MSTTRLAAAAALALALAVPVTALAQQAPPPAPTAGHAHHRNGLRIALGRLNLSPAQRSQIDQFFAQARGQNKGADRATRQANRKHLRAEIDGVLTPAQRTQLRDTLRAERRGSAPPAQH